MAAAIRLDEPDRRTGLVEGRIVCAPHISDGGTVRRNLRSRYGFELEYAFCSQGCVRLAACCASKGDPRKKSSYRFVHKHSPSVPVARKTARSSLMSHSPGKAVARRQQSVKKRANSSLGCGFSCGRRSKCASPNPAIGSSCKRMMGQSPICRIKKKIGAMIAIPTGGS